MNLHFTAEHEWVAVADGIATVGITEHAQRALGDLVFVQLPDIGASLAKGKVAAVIESVKAASDIYAPVSGKVIAANTDAVGDPSLINADAMGKGWLFKVELSDSAELEQLLDEQAYRKISA